MALKCAVAKGIWSKFQPKIPVFTIVVLCIFLVWSPAEAEQPSELEELLTKEISDTLIYGEVLVTTSVYDNWTSPKALIGELKAGETVELVRDRAFEWYLVRTEGLEGWIVTAALKVPEDPPTNPQWLTNSLLEAYVNWRDLSSRTEQLVWVDLDRQLTHVFVGKRGKWRWLHTMPCSTGKNTSPTLRGLHEIAERGDWFFTEWIGRGGKNWVQFSGPYMFHSLPMDRQGNIVDYTLLERRSSGCIRLSMEDSQWFYSFIKRGATVFVN